MARVYPHKLVDYSIPTIRPFPNLRTVYIGCSSWVKKEIALQAARSVDSFPDDPEIAETSHLWVKAKKAVLALTQNHTNGESR
jgi:hypothetical protein